MYGGIVAQWQVDALAPFLSTIEGQGRVLAEAAWRDENTRAALIEEAGRKVGTAPKKGNIMHLPTAVRGRGPLEVCDAVRRAAQVEAFAGEEGGD